MDLQTLSEWGHWQTVQTEQLINKTKSRLKRPYGKGRWSYLSSTSCLFQGLPNCGESGRFLTLAAAYLVGVFHPRPDDMTHCVSYNGRLMRCLQLDLQGTGSVLHVFHVCETQ